MSGKFVVLTDTDIGTPERFLGEEDAQKVDVLRVEAFAENQGRNADIRVLVAKKATVEERVVSSIPRLRLISTWGVGYDHIDVEAASLREIPVCINPVFTASMAEAALTLILATGKRLRVLMEAMDRWHRASHEDLGRVSELRGSTVGIIGFGRIGQRLEQLLKALETKRLTYSPSVPPENLPAGCEKLEFEEVLRQSDWIVLTAPLTESTYHMMDRTAFDQMKSTAFLVNVARGQLIDEQALYEALLSGKIAGAGLDVWEHEPPQTPSPLLELDNVIATPHALGRSQQNVSRIQQSIWGNVGAVLNGRRPTNIVNP